MTSVNPSASANGNALIGAIGAVEIIVHFLSLNGLPGVPDHWNTFVKSVFLWFDGLNSAFGLNSEWAANAGVGAMLVAALNWWLHNVSSDVAGPMASAPPPATGSFEK